MRDRHSLAGFLRQSVFSRLAGYEDVNDAARLCRDPVMRQVGGGRAVKNGTASATAMGRFLLTLPFRNAAQMGYPGPYLSTFRPQRE